MVWTIVEGPPPVDALPTRRTNEQLAETHQVGRDGLAFVHGVIGVFRCHALVVDGS